MKRRACLFPRPETPPRRGTALERRRLHNERSARRAASRGPAGSGIGTSDASSLQARSWAPASCRGPSSTYPMTVSQDDLGGNLRTRVGDHRAQLLAGLEDRHWARRHFDWITSPWVTRHARLPLADLECSKPAYLNVMLFSQRGFDGVEEGVYDPRTVLFGNEGTGCASDLRGDLFDQIGLRHWSPPEHLPGQSRGLSYGLTYLVSRACRNC